MWRIFFWTKHNASKLEQFLSEMESKGYILEKIFFIYFLKFKPCALKKSVYFATFECASISAFPMMDKNMSLARDYKGIKVVNGGLFSPTIYRICIENPDLSMLELQRKEILKKYYSFFKREYGANSYSYSYYCNYIRSSIELLFLYS